MTTRFVVLNGRLLPIARARIAPDDAGLQFGHGIFETLLARDGAPLFVADHLARLHEGAAALGIAACVEESGFRADAAALLASNDLLVGDARIKIILTAGSVAARYSRPPGMPSPPPSQAAEQAPPPAVTLLLLAERYRRRAEGVPFSLWLPGRMASVAMPEYKTLNYLHQRMLLREAERLGYDDAVLLDGDGHPVETTRCGLLARARGTWLAPPLEGRLDSITLRHTVALLRERGERVSMERFTRETLLAADDVWVMNSLAGVVPVSRIDDTVIPSPRHDEVEAVSAALFALGAD